ncbi:g8053 [Coccomyxa elongata]
MEGLRLGMNGLEMKAPGGAQHAMHSQHGFHVKSSCSSSQFPTIQEASLAEERGDSLGPAGTEQWRISSSQAVPPPQVGTGVKGLLDMCADSAMTVATSQGLQLSGSPVEVVGTAHNSTGVRRLVKAVVRGLRACQDPEASCDGLGGTYFFMNEAGRRAAIIKPCDEEPLAPNNPKGFVGRALGDPGLKPSVRVGEAAVREVAAFLLDREHFARVPHTVMVKVSHNIFHVSEDAGSPTSTVGTDAMSTSFGSNLSSSLHGNHAQPSSSVPSDLTCAKLASLQEYVCHDCDTSEMGASRFAARDVHRIGILDIRIWNTDRHAGNILVRRPRDSSANLSGMARLDSGQMELVPIDHGFCLPESYESPYFEWLFWPQAMMPFSEEELDYISRLDAAADKELLRRELPSLREESLRTLEVATLLLQRCAAAGLTLAEIGAAMSRPLVGIDEEASELERLCLVARELADEVCSSDEEEDSLSSSDAEGDWVPRGEASQPTGFTHKLAADPMDTSGSCQSSGTVFNASNSFELSFGGSGRLTIAVESLASLRGSAEDDTLHAASSTRSAEDLLFDLDDHHAAVVVDGVVEPCTPSAAAAHPAFRPSAAACMLSPGVCSVSSLGDAPSLSFSPLHAPACDFHSACQGDCSPPAAPLLPIARSVTTASALPKWHHHAQRLTHRQAQNEGIKRVRGPSAGRRVHRHRRTPQNAAGGSLFGGLDEEQWAVFIAALEQEMAQALAEGRWKQAPASKAGFGVSCPRF